MTIENAYTILPWLTIAIVAINIPFGFVRHKKPKFSRAWGRCIYIPILISILLRKLASLSFSAIPFFLFATLLGQVLGTIVSIKSLSR